MAYPYLTIDLDKIEHNARTVVRLCQQEGIEVSGVTKGVCGLPDVARAMLRGGVSAIADSRLENIHRLKAADIDVYYILLRVPPLSAAEEVVASVDMSLNSELVVLEALSEAAIAQGKRHDVMLMVDLGDLREGIWPGDVIAFTKQALTLHGIHIKGLGTNLACFSGVVPSTDNMNRLIELAHDIDRQFEHKIEWISGMNSSGFDMIGLHTMPRHINHARIGEAILLGRETIHRNPLPDTYQDAFVLHGEVLELKTKPSAPTGELGEDAFGHHPGFTDRGDIERALVNIGREDVDVDGIVALDPGIAILGASSGYLVVDVSAAEKKLGVGDELAFSLNYGALVAAMTSEYIRKHPRKMSV